MPWRYRSRIESIRNETSGKFLSILEEMKDWKEPLEMFETQRVGKRRHAKTQDPSRQM
jgi:hypothetical protein